MLARSCILNLWTLHLSDEREKNLQEKNANAVFLALYAAYNASN